MPQNRFLLAIVPAAVLAAGFFQPLSGAAPADPPGTGVLLTYDQTLEQLAAAPLLDMSVVIRVSGIVARSTVVQQFENPTDDWIEGIYVFPLPERAAVDGFHLVIGQRVIDGELQEKQAARRTYEKARAEGRKAGLVEQDRPNLFTTRVANIGPGEKVSVTLSFQEELRYERGRYGLRFPLVVAPRFHPSAAADGGSAGPLDPPPPSPPVMHPDTGETHPVDLVVELETGLALVRLESPTHDIQMEEIEGGRLQITPAAGLIAADRDFVLEWEPALADAPAATLLTEQREDGLYALVMVLPPQESARTELRLPRETVFVIDTSGSMGGASIRQARAALLAALDRLQPGDRFNLIEFDSSTRALFESPVDVSEASLDAARDRVRRLQADGGTNMLPAVRKALVEPVPEGWLRQVIFMTDGSVGNESQVFTEIQRLLGRSRFFTVGIGSAPNSHFMREAARAGRGTYTHISTPEQVQRATVELFARLEAPVLTDIALDWDGADADLALESIPDLYFGEPVVAAARLSGWDGRLTVRGRRAGQQWESAFQADFSGLDRGVHRLWARRRIVSLSDQLRLAGESDDLRSRLIELSLRHQVQCRFTSWVAVEQTPSRPVDAALQRRDVPVNLPAGWTLGLPRGAEGWRSRFHWALLSLAAAILLLRLSRRTARR